jgi:hypothetical protein
LNQRRNRLVSLQETDCHPIPFDADYSSLNFELERAVGWNNVEAPLGSFRESDTAADEYAPVAQVDEVARSCF